MKTGKIPSYIGDIPRAAGITVEKSPLHQQCGRECDGCLGQLFLPVSAQRELLRRAVSNQVVVKMNRSRVLSVAALVLSAVIPAWGQNEPYFPRST
jgi:hypothetical protein